MTTEITLIFCKEELSTAQSAFVIKALKNHLMYINSNLKSMSIIPLWLKALK